MNKELFDKGMEIRRAVLGEEYVNKAMSNADAFRLAKEAFAEAEAK